MMGFPFKKYFKMLKTKKTRISLVTHHSLYGYFFISPFIIGFILFFLTPLVLFIVMGFSDIKLNNSGMVFDFAGFAYYKIILIDTPDFLTDVLSSFRSILINVPAIVIYSFFIATVLNKKFKGRTFFRAIFFLPVIIASGVQVMSKSDSIAQNAIKAISGATDSTTAGDTINIAGYAISLLGTNYISIVEKYIQPIISNIYTITLSSGVQILIFLAALQTVPSSLYEAANIDGASSWESFWKITFPYLSPMIVVNVIYTLIDLLGNHNNNVIADIYETVNKNMKYALGASMGTFYFTITFILMGITIFAMSKIFYSKDK
ncbi:MAG: carbohydrate ABC transporter permease [Saccharofermentanales bacterium]